MGEKARVNEGWIQGLYGSLIDNALIDSIIYLFPQKTYIDNCTGRIGKLDYIGFYSSESNPSVVSKGLTALFEKILQQHEVDVIHIMGTEYAHSVAMINAAENTGNLKRTIVSIQGMPSVYYKHYLLGVPEKVIKRKRIKDIVCRSDLIKQQQLMQERGKSEKYVLSKAINVMGRTEWDVACTMQINADRKYFYGGEILRECFYQGAWDVNKIKRNSVFISQATYPVKGFHFFVEAAGFLITKYPDLKVYVGGRNIYSGATWKKSSYEKYVCDLMEKMCIRDRKEARLEELSAHPSFVFVKSSIADKAIITDIFEKYKPQVVVNLAAQAGVRYSVTNPDAYIAVSYTHLFCRIRCPSK